MAIPSLLRLPSRTGIAASSSLAVYVFDNPFRRSWLLEHRASGGCRFVTEATSPERACYPFAYATNVRPLISDERGILAEPSRCPDRTQALLRVDLESCACGRIHADRVEAWPTQRRDSVSRATATKRHRGRRRSESSVSFFLRGFAIHGYPSVPAYPASHGCVRLPMWIAPSIFASNSYGETIYVYY